MPEQPEESPRPSPPDKGPEDKKKDGWVDRIAKRSTGLPQDVSPPDKEDRSGEKSLWNLAGLGIQFAATVAIFAYIGYAADKTLGWSPWCTIGLSMAAVIGNLYLLIKEAFKEPPTK